MKVNGELKGPQVIQDDASTRCFKLNVPNCVNDSTRMHWLFQCRVFGMTLTILNSES